MTSSPAPDDVLTDEQVAQLVALLRPHLDVLTAKDAA